MTVAPPKVITFFRDRFILKHKKLVPYFSCTGAPFLKASLVLRLSEGQALFEKQVEITCGQ